MSPVMAHPTYVQATPDPSQFCRCGVFKCPCCSFNTDQQYKFNLHLQNHIKLAVEHNGSFICKCSNNCRPTAHFHCVYCSQTIIRKDGFRHHLSLCSSATKTTKAEVFHTRIASPFAVAASDACPARPPPATPDPPSPSSGLASSVPPPPPPPPPPPLRREKKATVMCCHCGIILNRRNLRLHILRRHAPIKQDITAQNHLSAHCVDYKNGVFAVSKSFTAPSTPIHVIKRTWGPDQKNQCELDICRINAECAERSNLCPFECHHIQSLTYCPPSKSDALSLTEDVLDAMVRDKWVGEDKKQKCLARQQEANDAGAQLSCLVTVCGPPYKKYVSVFEGKMFYYSRLGRVMVTYDSKNISWHCPCARPRQSCIHKSIAKWHLFETDPTLFRRTRSVEENLTQHFPTEVEGTAQAEQSQYPPEGKNLSRMVQYIFHKKKLPAVLPPDVVKTNTFPVHLIPSETFCTECLEHTPLSEPLLISSKAKILTVTDVIEGISTYSKCCYRCGMVYRYQEWTDGVHNFDDRILLSTYLCHFLRNCLQTHQAVGSAIEVLEKTSGKTYPSKQRILHAYLSFEALSDLTYTYSCVSCGYHPATVVMDLHKKGVFSMPVSSIEEPPQNFDGKVNAEDFWEMVSLEMISCGFVQSPKANPFVVHPSYHNWAPWIGPNTRGSDFVLNTEYKKVHSPYRAVKEAEFDLTEDRLTDELLKLKMEVVRSLCKQCGIDPRGSRMDLVGRLQHEMKNRTSYDKVFSQICGASGGCAVVTCPCAVVYGVKFNIRAESPRDFADLLLSMKHFPNVALYDFARGLATHTNLREPETLPFSPHEGRLLEPTEENITLATTGQIKVNFPWLVNKKPVPDENAHPLTGSSEHYALYDRFHEAKSKDVREVLRKLELVPELCGWVNSQCAKQLFSGMRKDNHFLNMMTPSSHIFLMRSILHHYNNDKNLKTLENMKKNLGIGLDIQFNNYGQTVFGMYL